MAGRCGPVVGLWLLAVVLLAGCRQPSPSPPTPGVDVQHYDVAIRLDPATGVLKAHARLDVVRPDTLATLSLDFTGMVIDSVRVDGARVVPERRGDRLRVPLPAGRTASRLDVAYRGAPRLGFYRAAYGGQPVWFTDAWPDEGRGWLPGRHHPSDPATLALTLTLPRGYEAVASGALEALDTLDAVVRYRWRLGTPAPTYAFAFAVADFSVTEDAVGDTLPVRYYLLAQDSSRARLLARTPQALAFFADVLGPYPFRQYASAQVPIRYAGMENASASFLQARLFQTGEVETVQMHELAHQWFGNRVTLADWRDLWLSEGTATYLATLFYEHADGLDAARRQWTEMAVLTPRRRRTHAALVPQAAARPRTLLTWVTYEKGASVLHLLRRALGDEAFFAALRAACRRYAARPLSTAAFRRVLEEAAGRDLSAFFDYWVYGSDLPALHAAWDPATRTLTWTVTGDAGTLDGVSFDLQVRQGSRVEYVAAGAGRAVLSGWDAAPPQVRPVGVVMRVEV